MKTKPPIYKTICAWCGELLLGVAEAGTVSHGICKECTESLLETEGAPVVDYSGAWDDIGGEGGGA